MVSLINNFVLKSLNILNHAFIKLTYLLAGYSIIFLAYYYWLFYGAPHPDAGYYLTITNLIYDGHTIFKDFTVGYTVLSFYVMLFFKTILGSYFNYKTALIIVFLIQFLNAFIIFLIGSRLKLKSTSKHVAVFTYLTQALFFEGRFYLLEPYSVLFGLLSFFTILKQTPSIYNYIGAGALAALSFFSKQYGLGFIFIILLYVLLKNKPDKKQMLKSALLTLFGFGLVFFIYHLLFYLHTKTFASLINQGTNGYEIRGGITGVFRAIIDNFKFFPWLLIIPIVYKHLKENIKEVVIFSFFGIIGFSFQFYVRDYLHYSLLIVPFSIIILMIIIDHLSIKQSSIILIFITLGGLHSLRVAHVIKKKNLRLEYNKLEKKLQPFIQEEKDLFIYPSNPTYNILYSNLNITPPLLNLSAGFGFEETPNLQILRSSAAKKILIEKNSYFAIMRTENPEYDKLKHIFALKKKKEIIDGFFLLE